MPVFVVVCVFIGVWVGLAAYWALTEERKNRQAGTPEGRAKLWQENKKLYILNAKTGEYNKILYKSLEGSNVISGSSRRIRIIAEAEKLAEMRYWSRVAFAFTSFGVAWSTCVLLNDGIKQGLISFLETTITMGGAAWWAFRKNENYRSGGPKSYMVIDPPPRSENTENTVTGATYPDFPSSEQRWPSTRTSIRE